MTLKENKKEFETKSSPREAVLLHFTGIKGYDVYNCSIPFQHNGKTYIYGRVERRCEWANSRVHLFEQIEKDEYSLVPNSITYQLEDPYITFTGDELILGGTHVFKNRGEIDTIYSYFYRGKEPGDLTYFTSGPKGMKDIRLVQMPDGIGVFSRPRNPEIEKKYGSASIIGFIKIKSIDNLCAEVVEQAVEIKGLFGKGEWGGCNQCYYLDSGNIGVIAHKSYIDKIDGLKQSVYVNTSFVFDPVNHRLLDEKILATRSSYPSAPPKIPELSDCTFTSGIVMRDDGKCDLYAGLGDTHQGRIIIDYPFEKFGEIITG